MLAKCKKSVEKECWGLSYKAFTGWRDCVTNNTPCLRCEGMECTNQGVNDSHSAGIRSPFNQDEGRACRERQRRMIPLSHANGAFKVPASVTWMCGVCACFDSPWICYAKFFALLFQRAHNSGERRSGRRALAALTALLRLPRIPHPSLTNTCFSLADFAGFAAMVTDSFSPPPPPPQLYPFIIAGICTHKTTNVWASTLKFAVTEQMVTLQVW